MDIRLSVQYFHPHLHPYMNSQNVNVIISSASYVLTGIQFYTECGFLSVGKKDGDNIKSVKENAKALSHEVSLLPYAELTKEYPYMTFDRESEGVFAAKQSGYINPRQLVKAQVKLAKQYGCHVYDSVVDSISNEVPKGHLVKMANGQNVMSKRVIVATGAFTFSRSLMPGGMLPDLYLCPSTVILVCLTHFHTL